ncbi:MAG: SprT-like domain-containing protein, partial [Fusobacteriaceae bacterium]
FIKRTARNIKSSGTCFCKKEGSVIIPVEIKIEEELFFHPKEMIAVLKHELAHLYELEETGKTRHGKKFKKLIHEMFNLPVKYVEDNPKSLEKRLIYKNNLEILKTIKARSLFSDK